MQLPELVPHAADRGAMLPLGQRLRRKLHVVVVDVPHRLARGLWLGEGACPACAWRGRAFRGGVGLFALEPH